MEAKLDDLIAEIKTIRYLLFFMAGVVFMYCITATARSRRK